MDQEKDLKVTKLKRAQLAARLMGTELTKEQSDHWKTKTGLVPLALIVKHEIKTYNKK